MASETEFEINVRCLAKEGIQIVKKIYPEAPTHIQTELTELEDILYGITEA